MKFFVAFAAFVASTNAAGTYVTGLANTGLANTGRSTVTRQEDGLGNYAFGYNEDHAFGGTFRKEKGGPGMKVGSYGLREADGRMRVVNYVADALGFRASVSTNEPGTDVKQDPAAVNYNIGNAQLVSAPVAHMAAPVLAAPAVRTFAAAPAIAHMAAPVLAAPAVRTFAAAPAIAHMAAPAHIQNFGAIPAMAQYAAPAIQTSRTIQTFSAAPIAAHAMQTFAAAPMAARAIQTFSAAPMAAHAIAPLAHTSVVKTQYAAPVAVAAPAIASYARATSHIAPIDARMNFAAPAMLDARAYGVNTFAAPAIKNFAAAPAINTFAAAPAISAYGAGDWSASKVY